MSGTYLTWLADSLRDYGCSVIEYQGWKTRARSSGGYTNGRPWIVMLHHTASGPSSDGQQDADYQCTKPDAAPVCNLYIDREGNVWVLAAGATNTNGKGRSRTVSKGTIPEDSMNTYAVGIECANDGVGETWPQVQIDAMFKATICCLDKLGLADNDVGLHEWYSPGRKIDPATCNVEGPWKPYPWTGNNNGTWDLDCVWAEVTNRRHGTMGDEVTDDDIQKIAQAVWHTKITSGDVDEEAWNLLKWVGDLRNNLLTGMYYNGDETQAPYWNGIRQGGR